MALTSASAFGDYFETAILAWFKGVTFPAAPTTLWVGLFTTNPTDTGTTGGTADGTEVTTTNGTGGFTNYQRVPVVAASGWSAIGAASGDSTGQQISNGALLPASGTAWTNNGGSTVTISGIGIWDASTAGHLPFYIPLGTSQPVTTTASFSIAIGGLVAQVD
jgi:hypothetical protein